MKNLITTVTRLIVIGIVAMNLSAQARGFSYTYKGPTVNYTV